MLNESQIIKLILNFHPIPSGREVSQLFQFSDSYLDRLCFTQCGVPQKVNLLAEVERTCIDTSRENVYIRA
jgi:hypothetical protein